MKNLISDIDPDWYELFVKVVEGQLSSFKPYPRLSDANVIIERAQRYPLSVSALRRSIAELVQERVIRLNEAFPKPVSLEFRARVAAMSSSDCRLAYQRDPDFKKQWDSMVMEDGDSIRSVPAEDTPLVLTREDYHRIPAATLAAKLKASGREGERWRAAIQALVTAGQI